MAEQRRIHDAGGYFDDDGCVNGFSQVNLIKYNNAVHLLEY